MKRTLIKDIFSSDRRDYEAMIRGWVRTRREAKGFSFLEINDGSTIKNIQVVADSEIADYAVVLECSTGASVEVAGTVVESPARNSATSFAPRQ
jgi:asparaginyl-tRNA synthetase